MMMMKAQRQDIYTLKKEEEEVFLSVYRSMYLPAGLSISRSISCLCSLSHGSVVLSFFSSSSFSAWFVFVTLRLLVLS